ncbi:guanylate cyclase domain-containing protein [Haematococcus lacustris]|uniref:Guanylate cyclase domain-containing protein n=1 Tax=Haematococcus lacustris TaxID=44745 RepID=A0A699ZHB0_HAELA|nr:guanylate cyclase domain-containing protein [Haematococcus lacustris]
MQVINTCWGMLEGFEPGSQLLGAVAVVPSYAALQLHREWRAWSAQPGPGEGQVDHPTNPGLSWTLARYLQLLLLYAVVNVTAVVALNMQALQAGPSRQAVATAPSYSLPPLRTPYSDAPHSPGSSSAGSWACRLCSRLDAWDAAVGATLGRLLAWCDPDLCLVAVCGPVAALSWFAAAHALLCGKQPCTVHAMTASAGITAALMLSGVDRNKLVRSASQARQLLDDLLPSHIVSALLEAHALPALNQAAPQALQPPATHHFDSSLDTSRHPSFVSIGNSTTSQTAAPLAASLLSCDKLPQGAAAGDAVPGHSGSGSAGLSQQLSQPQLPPRQPTHLHRSSSSHQFSSAPLQFLICPKGYTKEQSSMQSGAWGLSPLAKVCGSMPRPPVVPGVAPSEQANGRCSLSWDDDEGNSTSGMPDHDNGQVATISDWVWSEHPCETLSTGQPIPAIRSAAAEPVLLLPGSSEHHGSNVSEPRSSETGGMSGFFRKLTSSGLNVAPSSSGSSLPTPFFLMAPTFRDLTNMTSLPSRLGHQGNTVAPSHHAYGPHSNPALPNSMATWHPNVSVLFADIVGFSTVSQEVEPEQVFAMLNELYARYDSICETMPSLYKANMVAAGLLLHDADHAATMLRFALAMQQAAGQVQMPTGTGPVRIRVGIHSGPVTSGIIGKIRKRYCLVVSRERVLGWLLVISVVIIMNVTTWRSWHLWMAAAAAGPPGPQLAAPPCQLPWPALVCAGQHREHRLPHGELRAAWPHPCQQQHAPAGGRQPPRVCVGVPWTPGHQGAGQHGHLSPC